MRRAQPCCCCLLPLGERTPLLHSAPIVWLLAIDLHSASSCVPARRSAHARQPTPWHSDWRGARKAQQHTDIWAAIAEHPRGSPAHAGTRKIRDDGPACGLSAAAPDGFGPMPGLGRQPERIVTAECQIVVKAANCGVCGVPKVVNCGVHHTLFRAKRGHELAPSGPLLPPAHAGADSLYRVATAGTVL